MRPLSRRLLLGGFAAAVARPSHAVVRDQAITVGCWGGAYGQALQAVIDTPLARGEQITVHQVVSNEQARFARLAAATPEAHLDVALLSDTDAYRLSLRQLFAPVTTSGVGTLPQVLPGLRVPYGVPQSQTALCILYNASRLAEPPRSFAALFEAARQGRVGFSSELAIHNVAAAAITQRRVSASLESAKATFTALKRAGTLRLYPDNEALGAALAGGEIVMAPMWRSRGYVWQQAGRDVRDSVPSEGAIPFTILACVPGTAAVAPAMRYLEALLHPDAQVALAARLGLLPTVQTARVDETLLRRIGFTVAQRARFRPLSLSAVAQHGVALRQFWDRELV